MKFRSVKKVSQLFLIWIAWIALSGNSACMVAEQAAEGVVSNEVGEVVGETIGDIIWGEGGLSDKLDDLTE